MQEKIRNFDPRQEMRLQNYEIFHYRDAKLDSVDVHHHDFYEVYLFLGGHVTYSVEGKNYLLQRGDILLINPMELHQLRVTSKREAYERYVLWIDPAYLSRFSTQDTSLTRCFDNTQPGHSNLLRLGHQQWHLVQGMMEELVQETYGSGYGQDVAAVGILLRFMVEINRLAMEGQMQPQMEVEGKSALISGVLDFINKHYNESISLDKIAGEFFISKYHLSHEFNRIVGTSVYRYVVLKRLVIAKQMLGGGVPPTDVYLNCGFRDYANFYRCFKAEYGISPKQYMEQSRRDWMEKT